MKLVPEWKSLWRTATVQLAVLGAVLPAFLQGAVDLMPLVSGALQLLADHAELLPLLPDLLQLLADHSMSLPSLSAETRNNIRLVCLLLIPVARAIQQRQLRAAREAAELASLAPPAKETSEVRHES